MVLLILFFLRVNNKIGNVNSPKINESGLTLKAKIDKIGKEISRYLFLIPNINNRIKKQIIVFISIDKVVSIPELL